MSFYSTTRPWLTIISCTIGRGFPLENSMNAMIKSGTRWWWGLSTSTKGKEQSKKHRLLCKRGRDRQMSATNVTLRLLWLVKLKLPLNVLKLKRLVRSLSLLDQLRLAVIMQTLKCLSKMNCLSLLIHIPYCVHQSTGHRFFLTRIIISKFNRWYGINKCINDFFHREYLLVNNNPCCMRIIYTSSV